MAEQIGPEFMTRTRHEHQGPSDQRRGLPQPLLEIASGGEDAAIALPAPKDVEVSALDLRQAIERRVSVRKYSTGSLSLEELSFLLWCTQGVKQDTSAPPRHTMRTVPSAGARHAFETYLLINRVDGLDPGLYRFMALQHKLQPCRTDSQVAEELTLACLGQEFVTTSAATFIWAAVAYRMTWRYGQRGYRYLHLDAGHVCQNLYLAAEAVGCGVCAIAAFDDDAVNTILQADGEQQFAVYLATVGKQRQ